MSQSQYSLAWDSYKTNICSGFSTLQQNGEFVDMTIAADGHFVKVHQVLVALSSSYLKNLISSAPCQHPIIFLNNISHKVLCFILEYIYTGEVMVPSEFLSAFTEAAKSLHIKGLESEWRVEGVLDLPSRKNTTVSSVDNSDISHTSKKRKAPVEIEINLPRNARKVFVKPEGAHMSVNQNIDLGNSQDYSTDFLEDSGALHSDNDDFKQDSQQGLNVDMDQVKANPSNLLYTVSIRGSLQTILNRYIYNLNSTTSKAGVRRWRCVDYRNNKCNAFVVTKGNIVVNRANLHNHPFHDKKILAKIEKKAVFSALDEIEAYREKEKELDNDSFALDQFKDDEKNE